MTNKTKDGGSALKEFKVGQIWLDYQGFQRMIYRIDRSLVDFEIDALTMVSSVNRQKDETSVQSVKTLKTDFVKLLSEPKHQEPQNKLYSVDPDGTVKVVRTLRQWYAGQALMGLCVNVSETTLTPQQIAESCFLYADAMIAHEEAENDGK